MSSDTSLFCYGSLQLPEVMKAVTGKLFTGEAAQLSNHVIYRMRNAEYPGMIRETGGRVAGIIYENLTAGDFRALDAFEGDQYQRRLVSIDVSSSPRREAWAYIVRDGKRADLTDQPWTLETFLANDYEQFMQRFVIARRRLYSRD